MLSFFKKMKESSRPRCTALVAAAGSSRRMGGVNKLLEPLDGIPVLARTLTALQLAISNIGLTRSRNLASEDLERLEELDDRIDAYLNRL